MTEHLAQRYRRMRELLENSHFRSGREAGSTNTFGKVEPVQAQCCNFRAQLGKQLRADIVICFDLLFERTEPIAHESTRGFSDHGHFVIDLSHGVLTMSKTISFDNVCIYVDLCQTQTYDI